MPRTFLIGLIPIWLLALVVGSLLPFEARVFVGDHATLQHRIVHFLAFGATTGLLILLGRNSRDRTLTVGLVAVLAVTIEFLQHRIYGSPFEYWDVRDDVLGSLAAMAVATFSPICAKLNRTTK